MRHTFYIYGTVWNWRISTASGHSDVTRDPLRSLNIIIPLNAVFQPSWLLLACAIIHY